MEREISEKIQEMEKQIKKIDHFLNHAPSGSLKTKKRNGRVYYYWQCKDTETQKWVMRYITKADKDLAKELAQKSYYLQIRPMLEMEILALKKCLKRCNEKRIEDAFDLLTEERRVLVKPIWSTVKGRLLEWNKEVYVPNPKHPENLRFETDRGEMVRSKSELIIANALFRERDILLYKYERPLTLKANGQEIVVYPDFTILNTITGKITYWEHAGRMDDPRYSIEFVQKMNAYTENGVITGTDLIITYETMNIALNIGNVKRMINMLK